MRRQVIFSHMSGLQRYPILQALLGQDSSILGCFEEAQEKERGEFQEAKCVSRTVDVHVPSIIPDHPPLSHLQGQFLWFVCSCSSTRQAHRRRRPERAKESEQLQTSGRICQEGSTIAE